MVQVKLETHGKMSINDKDRNFVKELGTLLAETYYPGDVFPAHALETWAEENGYVARNDTVGYLELDGNKYLIIRDG